MAVKDLREAFNAAADGKFTCQTATLGYTRENDVEWQILSFSGTGDDGMAFATQSKLLKPGANVLEAARAAAQVLIEKGKLAP